MDTGIGYFATHDAAGPGEGAPGVAVHGTPAIYIPEHTHIPAARATPAAASSRAATRTRTTCS